MVENFTDKEKDIICGLEAIGLFCGSQTLLITNCWKADVYTVEDIIQLYDETGERRTFRPDGELTIWAREVLDGPLLSDLNHIRSKMPEEITFRTDYIESGIVEIIRKGF